MGNGTYAELDKGISIERINPFLKGRDFLNVTLQKEENYAFAWKYALKLLDGNECKMPWKEISGLTHGNVSFQLIWGWFRSFTDFSPSQVITCISMAFCLVFRNMTVFGFVYVKVIFYCNIFFYKSENFIILAIFTYMFSLY